MISCRMVDESSVLQTTQTSTLLVIGTAKGPVITPKLIGKWNRKKYQYLSRRRKVQYLRDWRVGIPQTQEFIKEFGEPNFKER